MTPFTRIALTELHAPYERIAEILDDFARAERRTAADRAKCQQPGPCEACNRETVYGGGICPTCLELAAGACRRMGGGRRTR